MEGEYGVEARQSRGWTVIAVLWSGLALFGVVSGRWLPALANAALAAGAGWLAWCAPRRTVVAPEGLLVRRGFRWPVRPWAAATGAAQATRWEDPPTVRVRLADGGKIVTDIPNDRYDDFIAYAAAHGADLSHDDGPGQDAPRGPGQGGPQ